MKVFVRLNFNTCRDFPVDDSGSNEEAKSKEVLGCSSRSSVSKTGKALEVRSSNPKPTSSPIEINPVPFYSPGQPEKQSRNEIMVGASSLVDIWEARSRQSNSTQSQSLIDSRTSYGLSLSENWYSSSFSNSLNNNGNKDSYSQSYRSYVSDSYEKEREGSCLLQLVTRTPRIRGRQAYVDFLLMILRERGKELKRIADLYAVSKFSPRGCERLQYMLRIRSLERHTAIQERHRSKSDAICKPKIAKKAVLSEVVDSKNDLKKPEFEKKATEEGEGSRKVVEKAVVKKAVVEKAVVKKSVESNKTSLSIAEKVNLWNSKEITYRRNTTEKASRKFIDVDTVERKKESRKKEEDSSYEEGTSMEIEEYRIIPQEDKTARKVSGKSGNKEKSSQDDKEPTKAEKQEASEALCVMLESPRSVNGWDETEMEDEDYGGESAYYDWVSDISRPRSYWEDLRKQREREVMSKDSKKDDIKGLIKERTVSRILRSDIREMIDKSLISRVVKRLQVESNLIEEEECQGRLVECSPRYQQKLEENDIEKVDLESITVSDGFSLCSAKSFEEHEASATISLNSNDHENTSSEIQICDLREQIKELQREMIQLQNLVTSCVKSAKLESFSVPDYLFGLDNLDETAPSPRELRDRDPRAKIRREVSTLSEPGSPRRDVPSPYGSTSSAPVMRSSTPELPPPVLTKPEAPEPVSTPKTDTQPEQVIQQNNHPVNTQWQYAPGPQVHYQSPVYYVPNSVQPGNHIVQPVQMPGQYLQQYHHVPMGYHHQPQPHQIPGPVPGQIYGGTARPVMMAVDGVNRTAYYGMKTPGPVHMYHHHPGMVVPGVEEQYRTESDTEPGRGS